MNLSKSDTDAFRVAVDQALVAEGEGNLPIGAVIVYAGKIIALGKNAIWSPLYNPNRHAEVEALRSVPEKYWGVAREMTIYTTLEPCLMCAGAIFLHHLGRVVYGSADPYGGASVIFGRLPAYFEAERSKTKWIGPANPEVCDPLYERVMRLVSQRVDPA